MDPATLMALKQLAPDAGQIGTGLKFAAGLGKTVYGISQLAGNERPEDFTYEIPSEVLEALQLARSRMGQPMPGADLQREKIGQTTAQGMSRLNQRGGASGAALGAATQLLSKEYESLNELAVKQSQFELAAEQGLQRQLSNVAEYRDREFDLNVRRPYEQALAEFFQNRNAGTQNLFGGLNDMGNTAEAYFQNKMLMDELGYGNSGGGIPGGIPGKSGGRDQFADILPNLSKGLLAI